MTSVPLCPAPAKFSSLSPPGPPPRPPSPFSRLYAEHRTFLRSVLRRQGIAARDVDDLVQEVFLVAFRRQASLVLEQARPWLLVVAVYLARNHRKLARHRIEHFVPDLPDFLISAFDPESIDASATFARFLRRLRPKLRAVFVPYALEGRSLREIATALQIKRATAFARLYLARTYLARFAH